MKKFARCRAAWIGFLLAAAGIAIQCRFLPGHLPPDWRWVVPENDYQHYLPVQLRAADPRLYANDALILRAEAHYPRAWRKASGWLGSQVFPDMITADWAVALATLLLAAAGMGALALAATGNPASAGLAALFLLAGNADPHTNFFVSVGTLAVPHEQALSLYPWLLLVPLLRAKRGREGTLALPWELLPLALQSNIHPGTSGYGLLSTACVWALIPAARPVWNMKAVALASLCGAAAWVGWRDVTRALAAQPVAGREFFMKFFWHMWPVSGRPEPLLRAAATSYWIGRCACVLAGIWLLARPWARSWRRAPEGTLLVPAAVCTAVYALWILIPFTVFLPRTFLVSQRAFIPAAIPLFALACGFYRTGYAAGRERLLILLLGGLLLSRALPLREHRSLHDIPQAHALEKFAARAADRIPMDALVLIPPDRPSLRILLRRACFGDRRVFAQVSVLDRTLQRRLLPLWIELSEAYRDRRILPVLEVGGKLGASFAVLPGRWGAAAARTVHADDSFSLVRLDIGLGDDGVSAHSATPLPRGGGR